jgi:hypothetical protein
MVAEGDGWRWRWCGDADEVVVGHCVCKREAGGGIRAESHKNERSGSVSGAPCKTVVDFDGGRWWCGADKVAAVVGCCVRKRKAGGGLGAKHRKNERNSSVLGAPCETAVEGDGGRWWCGVGKLVVVVGLCVRKCEAGEWAGGQKPRNLARQLGFGCPCETAAEGDGGRWWCGVDEVSAVAGSCVRRRKVGQGAGAKETETELPWLGFGLHLECKRRRGVL